jgi:hypothetical protein
MRTQKPRMFLKLFQVLGARGGRSAVTKILLTAASMRLQAFLVYTFMATADAQEILTLTKSESRFRQSNIRRNLRGNTSNMQVQQSQDAKK